jgi:hypothetical protein
MWIIYIVLATVAASVVAAVAFAIYASAVIARPLEERMHRATMLCVNEPTEPRPIRNQGAAAEYASRVAEVASVHPKSEHHDEENLGPRRPNAGACPPRGRTLNTWRAARQTESITSAGERS